MGNNYMSNFAIIVFQDACELFCGTTLKYVSDTKS